MKKKVFIYGVPGSGKTYFSRQLCHKINYKLIEADKLRDSLQKNTTKEKNPFIFLGTCQAYQCFGKQTQENVVKGLQAVRATFSEIINEKIDEYKEGFIMEGAILDPQELSKVKNATIICLITKSGIQHKNQFFKHRTKNSEAMDEFVGARMIQEFLVEEANEYNIFILKNINNTKQMLGEVDNL